MQFVANGPDVPDSLLRQHEDGRVVFFAGAGVSQAAGLPGFRELVIKLFEALNVVPNDLQRRAICDGQYDRAIRLLDEHHVGGRIAVRDKVASILTPDSDADTTTHRALLTLAKTRSGQTRLVTTNIDPLFEHVLAETGDEVACHRAPLLPVPKKRWDGLVYLHGLLPNGHSSRDFDGLVLSSGDFGLAYLIERWAARFVSELFRNYIVCFVGYSLNDPVLRYMTDALAADQLLGESPTEVFAFADYSADKDKVREEWKARSVTPILYSAIGKHKYLHRAVHEWASTYRDGIIGKESIVVKYGRSLPLKSTVQDDYVGRVLWALSDPSGLPAKRFADLDPVPPLHWLEPFCEDRYCGGHLTHFGINAARPPLDELKFSFLNRPAPYTHAPRMTPVCAHVIARFDKVMEQMARWLTRHLGDPRLVLWVADHGGQLHPTFAWMVDAKLEQLDELAREGKTEELARIRAAAPKAIPGSAMRILWRLVLGNRILPRPGARALTPDISRLRQRLRRDGVTPAGRMELQKALTPHVSLSRSFSPRSIIGGDEAAPERLTDLVDARIVLPLPYPHDWIDLVRDDILAPQTARRLLPVFGALLGDAMDLKRELGQADEKRDGSYISQPSIGEHPQNSRFRDWTVLVDLTRDAWLATAATDSRMAHLVAESWSAGPYPLFRRLGLFAATHSDVIPPHQAVRWLVADDGWWLWSIEAEREAIRLLIHLAGRLTEEQQDALERIILAGPPSSMFEDGFYGDIVHHVARKTWLRLAKMREAGHRLGGQAHRKLADLATEYPKWALTSHERDEFPFWRGQGTLEPGAREGREHTKLPRRPRALVALFQAEPDSQSRDADDWAELCRDSFRAAACALCALAQDDHWPTARWRVALTVWSDEELAARSWRYLSAALVDAPPEHLALIGYEVSQWLKSVAKTTEDSGATFPALCRDVIETNKRVMPATSSDSDPVTTAINHPVGHATKALLEWWYQQLPEDGQGLPETMRGILTNLCDAKESGFRHGRVWLAVNVVSLLRVDSQWTSEHLLPLFDWEDREEEARAMWTGFLWSPRVYHPLFLKIRQPFLDTARHYQELGEFAKQYAALLTFAALDPGDSFRPGELKEATSTLPDAGLVIASRTLRQVLKSAGSQRVASWENRILPYLNSIWPTAGERKTKAISTDLAYLCANAGDAFPHAVERLRDWLQPLREPLLCVYKIDKHSLCKQFPQPSLQFLDALIGDGLPYYRGKLRECLQQIREADSLLGQDPRFRRLNDLARGG